MKVVISQPMYLPWCGLFDQLKNCDVFVFYDDVQLSRGFYNRVQLKKKDGIDFITVPISNKKQKTVINQALIFQDSIWINKHKALLEQSFKDARFKNDAIELFEKIHYERSNNLAELGIKSILEIADYLNLLEDKLICKSSDLNISGVSSQRLLDITARFNGNVYITGHGALNYLNHDIFEAKSIEVRYMNYFIKPYEQSYGEYTPYVTSLDAIAYLGRKAVENLKSTTIYWKELIHRGLF